MNITGKKIFTSFVWKFLEKCSVHLTTFIVTIILARILTPQEFGDVAIIIIFVNLANVIVEGGLTAALIQKKNADQIDFSTIFYCSLFLSVIVYLLLYFSSPYIARFYNSKELVPIIRFLSIMIMPCAINSVQKAFVYRNLLFKEMFVCSCIAIIISGIIGIVMALKGYGIWALSIQIVVNQIVVTTLMFIIIPWHPLFIFSLKRFWSLFDFGWKIFLSNFIIAVYEDIRGLLIGKMYNPSTLAFFERGKQFPSLIMGNINTSIQTVLFPAFSYAQDENEKLKRMIKTSSQMSCFIVFPLLSFLFVAAKPIVEVLLNDNWLPVVPFIQIFSAAFFLMPLQSSNMIAIKSMGYSNITLKMEIIKKIVEALILFFSFQFNVYVVAWGVVVYNCLSLFINLYPVSNILGYTIREQIMGIGPILLISITSALISYWLAFTGLQSVIILLLQLLIGMITYLSLSFLFKVEALSVAIKMFKQQSK